MRSPPTSVSPRFVSLSTIQSNPVQPNPSPSTLSSTSDSKIKIKIKIKTHDNRHSPPNSRTHTLFKNPKLTTHPTVPLSDYKPCPFLTPLSNRSHPRNPSTHQLAYGSVQWRNVLDELENGVFDVFVNGGSGTALRVGCFRVVNQNKNSGSRGGLGVAWRVLKNEDILLFPESWFFLINFNDGIFLWVSLFSALPTFARSRWVGVLGPRFCLRYGL